GSGRLRFHNNRGLADGDVRDGITPVFGDIRALSPLPVRGHVGDAPPFQGVPADGDFAGNRTGRRSATGRQQERQPKQTPACQPMPGPCAASLHEFTPSGELRAPRRHPDEVPTGDTVDVEAIEILVSNSSWGITSWSPAPHPGSGSSPPTRWC